MHLTPTHINYYHVCHRKLWLFHHGIRMEHSSDTVTEGRADIRKWLAGIERITALAKYPPVINSMIGKKCSYYDFCYVTESAE